MIEQIKHAISQAVPDAEIHVADPHQDGQHFQALVISPAFEGVSLVKQHRMVMKALSDELTANEVHALSLKTFTPDKWARQKQKYMP